mgnify:CR=1 FL=1
MEILYYVKRAIDIIGPIALGLCIHAALRLPEHTAHLPTVPLIPLFSLSKPLKSTQQCVLFLCPKPLMTYKLPGISPR